MEALPSVPSMPRYKGLLTFEQMLVPYTRVGIEDSRQSQGAAPAMLRESHYQRYFVHMPPGSPGPSDRLQP